MAERSFKTEVEQLKIPAGEVFRGEGILAITKALLENGVGYVGGYQGAPISHLMDVLADAQEILADLDVRFDANASEAAAAAMLAASVNYPIRGAVTFKSVVGTNVASDALANLASSGVKGGAWAYDPPLKTAVDFERLRMPVFTYDERQTQRRLEWAGELLGSRAVTRACAPAQACSARSRRAGFTLRSARGGPARTARSRRPRDAARARRR